MTEMTKQETVEALKRGIAQRPCRVQVSLEASFYARLVELARRTSRTRANLAYSYVIDGIKRDCEEAQHD